MSIVRKYYNKKANKKGSVWFKSLTPEQREIWIKKKQSEKSAKRMKKLKNYKNVNKYKCTDCIHSKTGNCEDREPCKMYFNMDTDF